MFSGCITALVTPFCKGKLDLVGLRKNVCYQIEHGADGLLVGGSTGEAAGLTQQEWEQSVAVVTEAAAGRVPVLVGTGTNNTAKSLPGLKAAKRLGADAVLVVAPYYVKPTQEGLYRHFRTLADTVRIPMVLYNIPGRTAVNVLPATIERLARDCSNFVAVKEASGILDQSTEIVNRCGDRVTVLSGDDSLTLPIMSVGGRGVISVVSNIVPGDVAAMVRNFLEGNSDASFKLHHRLFPLIKALFCETNPIPVKAAMQMLGMPSGEPRLPLTPLSEQGRTLVAAALKTYGLKTLGAKYKKQVGRK